MSGRDYGDRATLTRTIARLQDETERAELNSNLGGRFYGLWRAKLAELVAARTELARRDAQRKAGVR